LISEEKFMAKTYVVQNVSKRILPITLDTFKGKRRDSIHLGVKEKSRPLTEAEFKSREIAELFRTKPRPSLKLVEDDPIVVSDVPSGDIQDKSIEKVKKKDVIVKNDGKKA
jgi:hypothetical protein